MFKALRSALAKFCAYLLIDGDVTFGELYKLDRHLPCCQGRVKDGVMEGQALHFRWGDGSKFICEETKDCLVAGVIQKNLGKFRSVNRGSCSDVKYICI